MQGVGNGFGDASPMQRVISRVVVAHQRAGEGVKHAPRVFARTVLAEVVEHRALGRSVAPSTQNQAESALLFFYRVVLQVQLPGLDEVVAAKEQRRLPVVLTPSEG